LHDLAESNHAADVLAGSADAIIGLDGDFTVRYWSAGARRLLSYHDHDIIGESILLLVSAERRHALQQLLTVAREGAQINDRDVAIRNCDGRDIDVSLSAFMKRRTNTHPAKALPARTEAEMVVVLRDIDVRRIAERRVRHLGAQLVRRAQELQAIFDIAPVGMVIADSPDCVHLRSNLALARILGKERASDVTLSDGASYAFWRDGAPMPPELSPLHLAVAQRGVIDPIELEIRVQGRISTMIAYAAPVIDQDNSVVGAIAVFVDITAMKRVHAEHQHLLAEAIAARATAEDASRLKEEFLATVSHELRTPLNAMHGWLEIMHRKPDPQTQARGLDVIRRNVRAQTRVIEDILDVSAFVTGKTRLSPRPIDLLEVAVAAVESMRPTAEAKSIILSLHCDVASAPVNGDFERLQQIVWNLLSNAVKFTQGGGHVSLTLHADDGTNADSTYADGTNADSTNADSTNADGTSADTANQGDHLPTLGDARWIVSVSDSGEGIDAGFLPYVFDRFRQADSSAERRHQGLGLGLAIVRHLVELHGGHVAVESPGRGHGATFHVYLPALVAQANVLPAVPEAVSEQVLPVVKAREPVSAIRTSGSHGFVETPGHAEGQTRSEQVKAVSGLVGMDILLVEDDPSAADMLSFALRDDGATVRVAHSAAAAWEALLARRPDAIVSDIGMPERDGCSLLRAWRDAEAAQVQGRIFAVAVTAYARDEDRERALSAGFDAFLTKPIVPSMVTSLLIERLGIHFAVNQ
jgi:PAS domain S-box-containing protein